MTDIRREFSDKTLARLRTATPAWWASLVVMILAWLAPRLSADLYAAVDELLRSPAALAAVIALVTLVWHATWGWLGPRIPDQFLWVLRLAMGSAQTPAYGDSVLGRPLDGDEARLIRDIRQVEGRDTSGRRHDDA